LNTTLFGSKPTIDLVLKHFLKCAVPVIDIKSSSIFSLTEQIIVAIIIDITSSNCLIGGSRYVYYLSLERPSSIVDEDKDHIAFHRIEGNVVQSISIKVSNRYSRKPLNVVSQNVNVTETTISVVLQYKQRSSAFVESLIRRDDNVRIAIFIHVGCLNVHIHKRCAVKDGVERNFIKGAKFGTFDGIIPVDTKFAGKNNHKVLVSIVVKVARSNFICGGTPT